MNYRHVRILRLSLFLLPLAAAIAQRSVEVKTPNDLREALKKDEQGIHIILSDGEYNLTEDLLIAHKANKKYPMVIRAKNRGKATILGKTRVVLRGAEHIVIEGLNFESTNGPAIQLCGCSFVQITRNTFHLKETKRGSWILVDGIRGDSIRLSHHNRIDHNLFERKSLLGNFITIEGTMRSQPQVSQYDRIDHNLFADIGPRVDNVLEAIRAGAAEYSLSSGFTVIEDNLFERCDGDPEYISIKSSDDTIRRNTFRQCLGSLSLRHGNRNTAEGNIVLGDGRTGIYRDSTGKTSVIGTGGVRLYGNGMHVVNNYFEGLTGKKWDAAFVVMNGNAEYGDGQPLTKHFRIHDAVIESNILVNNQNNFEIGYPGEGSQGKWWRLAPIGLRFQKNVIVGSQDTLIKIYTQPLNSSWENNLAWATGSAVVSRVQVKGVRVIDPKLVNDNDIWHLPNQPVFFHPLKRNDVGPESN